MNYIVRYKTEIGDFCIDENFDCWHRGSLFNNKAKALNQAKNICQKNYTDCKNSEIGEHEERIKKLRETSWNIEDHRHQL